MIVSRRLYKKIPPLGGIFFIKEHPSVHSTAEIKINIKVRHTGAGRGDGFLVSALNKNLNAHFGAHFFIRYRYMYQKNRFAYKSLDIKSESVF